MLILRFSHAVLFFATQRLWLSFLVGLLLEMVSSPLFAQQMFLLLSFFVTCVKWSNMTFLACSTTWFLHIFTIVLIFRSTGNWLCFTIAAAYIHICNSNTGIAMKFVFFNIVKTTNLKLFSIIVLIMLSLSSFLFSGHHAHCYVYLLFGYYQEPYTLHTHTRVQ